MQLQHLIGHTDSALLLQHTLLLCTAGTTTAKHITPAQKNPPNTCIVFKPACDRVAYLHVVAVSSDQGRDDLYLMCCQLGRRGWSLAALLPQHTFKICTK